MTIMWVFSEKKIFFEKLKNPLWFEFGDSRNRWFPLEIIFRLQCYKISVDSQFKFERTNVWNSKNKVRNQYFPDYFLYSNSNTKNAKWLCYLKPKIQMYAELTYELSTVEKSE